MSRYKEFLVKDILKVEQTKSIVSKCNLIKGNIPYVTRKSSNNGYTLFCGNKDKLNKGNCITIGAETGIAFYQPYDFVAGNKVYKLSNKSFDKNTYLYLTSVLNKYTVKYNYLDARIPQKIKNEVIALPVDSNGNIDFEYMENYIENIQNKHLTKVKLYLSKKKLKSATLSKTEKDLLKNSHKKEKFKLKDLFTFSAGDKDIQNKHINGKGEYFINSGETNYGIKGKTDFPAKVFPKNTITIDFLGNAYFRSFAYKLATHNHVFSLNGDIIKNEKVGLYIVSSLSYLKKKHSFNEMATIPILKNYEIDLPVKENKEIDFDYMEKYIKAIQKIVIKDVTKYIDNNKTILES